MERGEWDEEPEYPRAPLPAHERQWRHPSELGLTEWNRSEPPLVVGRGLSVATGTVGAVLAIGLLWLMVPHSNRGGGGVAQVSSTVHAVGGADGSAPRPTSLPLSIVSSSTVAGSSGQSDGTLEGGTTGRTFAATTASPASGVVTSPIDETTPSDPDDTTTASSPSNPPLSSSATNTTQTTTPGTGSGITSSSGTGTSTPTSTATQPSGPTTSGPTPSTAPVAVTTSTPPPTSTPSGGTGGVVFAVALTDDHFVATTAAAVGGQSSVNVQLPTGNTVVGDVVSVNSGSGIAVLSIPSDTETTPLAASSSSTSNADAMVMTPEPTPATVWQDDAGTQITTDPSAQVGEGALVLDSSQNLIGLCTLTADGVQVVGAQDLLDAINGAIANQPTATLGLDVNPEGLAVKSVTPGGPAETATIRVGDMITAVDGSPVATPGEIKAAVQSHHPGETATLTVIRAGTTEPVDIPVVLGANPGL